LRLKDIADGQIDNWKIRK